MLSHNVSALLKSPAVTTRDIQIDEPRPRFGPGLQAASPVRGSARLYRTQNAIVVIGDVELTMEVECSRCLEPCGMPIAFHFEEEFQPTVSITTGAPVDTAEDEALRIDEHHVLDMTEIVRQYLLTNLPLKPVCKPHCAGLCGSCGADLNSGPCACPTDAESSPFRSLALLLEQGQ